MKNTEDRAVSKIQEDKKHLFKYANRFRKTLIYPSVLVDENDNLIIDATSVANQL